MTAHHWLAAFVAVNVLDAVLTLWALRLAAEANPLIRALMRRVHPALALVIVRAPSSWPWPCGWVTWRHGCR